MKKTNKRMRIEGEEQTEAPPVLHCGLGVSSKERKYDLHIHSSYSDGINTPAEIIRWAKEIGLQGIAITDHDTAEGVPKAKKIAESLDIDLIPGIEITTPFGDILALGIEEPISGRAKNASDIIEIADKIHERGGLAIIAHPFAGFWKISFPEIIKEIKKAFDAIEVFNALSNINFSMGVNVMAMQLAKKAGLPGIAGSDAQ
ncbi:MAG: PHP domain-containing protein [Candidatus Aenigmarchaeota archaeon]|nr:PHP domain-containing protein [Candidatus Aenigmarchaeota archaeon]